MVRKERTDRKMSLPAFLVSGKVVDFLVRPVRSEITRTGGRPVVRIRRQGLVEKIAIIDPVLTSQVQASNVVRKLSGMINTDGLDAGRDMYVLWEVWMDRKDNLAYDADFSEAEMDTILNGYTQGDRGLCSVVRVIRKVKPEKSETQNPLVYYKSLADYNTNIPAFPVTSDSQPIRSKKLPRYELERDFLTRTVGQSIDLTTIGISCGGLFQFPTWIDDIKLATFIREYNVLARNEINFRPANGRRITFDIRKQRYKTMNDLWLPLWLDCIQGQRPLNGWTNTFSISLLFSHTFGSMSMFTTYGAKYTPEPNDDDKLMELTVTSPMDGYLVPVKLVLSWNGMLALLHAKWKFAQPDKKFKIGTYAVENVDRGMPAQMLNMYALLLKANGGQGVEHVNLSSFLGSAAHTSAALTAFKNGQEFHRHLETSIANVKLLTDFSNATPTIAQASGKVLAETKNALTDPNMPDETMRAVEFGVYLPARTFNGSYFYSRIDALANHYLDTEGFSLWEYKTKWGDDRSIMTLAALDDILQAAFYCYCIEKMTGVVEEVFYIRYVKIECTAEKPKVSVYTHKYLWRAGNERMWDFDSLLDGIDR